MWLRSVLVVATLLLTLGACNGYVRHGAALYADGRYIEAAEVFERTEGRLADSSPHQKAEYGLYRGLTLLVLGDLQNSERWMKYAYDVDRAVPGSLGANRRALLDRGWYDLGQQMRATPPQRVPQPAATALAASEPPPQQHPAAQQAAPPSPNMSSDPSTRRSLVPQRQ